MLVEKVSQSNTQHTQVLKTEEKQTHIIRYKKVQYSTVQYSTVQCSTVQ
jgi:hypothetical protein